MAKKKLKSKLSQARESGSPSMSETGEAIRESANQIWLAGLGAFSKVQSEGGKIFESLVKQGKTLEDSGRQVANEKISEVRRAVETQFKDSREKATSSWDKIENVFETRVAKALNRLGVPTSDELQNLGAQVDKLQRRVTELSKQEPAAKKSESVKVATKAKATAPKPNAKKPPAKKAAAQKAAAQKAAPTKTGSKKATVAKSATKKSGTAKAVTGKSTK